MTALLKRQLAEAPARQMPGRAAERPYVIPQRNARIEDVDRSIWTDIALTIGAVLVVLIVLFVAANGIARALERPEACRGLNAAECTAMMQERAR